MALCGERGFFGAFNRAFDAGNRRYQGLVGRVLSRSGRFLAIYVGLALVMGVVYLRVPSSFLPDEDQGVLVNLISLPSGSTQQATLAVAQKVADHYLKDEGKNVDFAFAIAGFSSNTRRSCRFTLLKTFTERKEGEPSIVEDALGAVRSGEIVDVHHERDHSSRVRDDDRWGAQDAVGHDEPRLGREMGDEHRRRRCHPPGTDRSADQIDRLHGLRQPLAKQKAIQRQQRQALRAACCSWNRPHMRGCESVSAQVGERARSGKDL